MVRAAIMARISTWVCVTLAIVAMPLAVGAARGAESEPWRLLSSTPPFPPTISIPMGVYDPVRQRVLAIEADLVSQPIAIFAFDPGPEPRWSVLPVSGTAPLEHYLASVVYDPLRDRLLVIGSRAGLPVEVWAATLSGTPSWQKLATTGDPPSRWGHSAIYDAAHDRVVMFGGVAWNSYPKVYLSDTWSLSLATGAWTQIATTGSQPPVREGHGALYDPVRQRMLVFAGHYEDSTRHFLNDLWQLSLGDTTAWSEIAVDGPLPGARSAFATVYDPLRRRMLVHGGINAQSGVEPDDLWGLSLDGTPAWTPIVPAEPLRGRSYPLDVYDPAGDRLLACGGAGYPQASALSLSAPDRWDALLPACCPLASPSARSSHAVVYDSRRDRFLVVGGDYSPVDSATWIFRPEGEDHWGARRTPTAPLPPFLADLSQFTVYDSLGDRVLMFGGGQALWISADSLGQWAALGPRTPSDDWSRLTGSAAGVALDTRRNRLIVTGGYVPYAHSAGFSVDGVWSLSLGPSPAWSFLGNLPFGSYGHAQFYDPIRDRLVIVGGTFVNDTPRSRRARGAVVWTTPVDSALQWTSVSVIGDAALPGPPDAHAAYDPASGRLFLASDSTVRVRQIDQPGSWTTLASSTPTPTLANAIAFDPVRDQLLALFASLRGSATVDAWALAVGPLSVTVLSTDRTADAVTIRLRSVTAYGLGAILERRDESTDWSAVAPLAFGIDGTAAFTDRDVRAGHDYSYRVSVTAGATVYHSDAVFVPDPGSLQLALFGARPNPSAGALKLAFSLPAAGPAHLEVFDIQGRRRLSRDVGSLGPGLHVLSLTESASWRAGVYYARLQRGGQSRSARLILLP